MNRLQIILIIVAIIMIGILFSLPKTRVNTSNKTIASTPMRIGGNPAASALSSEEKAHVTQWKRPGVNQPDSLIALYTRHGHYDSAAYYTEQIYNSHQHAQLLDKLADLYEQAFQVESDSVNKQTYAQKATTYYQMLVDRYPSRHDFKTKLALLTIYSNHPMEGIKLLKEVVEKDPKNRDALYFLGRFSMQSGQYDKAVQRYEQLLRYYHSDVLARYWLAHSYTQLGRKQEAITAFKHVQTLLNTKTILTTEDSLLIQDSMYQLSLLNNI